MKLKTQKTMSKRVRKTGSGKIMQANESHHHLRDNKSKRQLRAAKGESQVASVNVARIKKLVPYL